MNTNFNYSDLIQLFLDGECTEVESSVLFAEMSRNPHLQSEFQQASQFSTLMRNHSLSTKPPVDLSSLVMNKVGLSATATAITTTTFSIGKILSALGLISVGVLSTLAVIRFIPEAHSVAEQSTIKTTQQAGTSLSYSPTEQPPVADNIASKQLLPTRNAHTAPATHVLSSTPVQQEPYNVQQPIVTAEVTKAEAQSAHNTPDSTTETKLIFEVRNNEVFGYQQPDIQQSQHRYVTPIVTHSNVVISPPEGHTSWFSPRYISIRSAVPVGSLFAQTNVQSGDRVFALQWPISPTGSFGIELGRAYLPTYAIQTQDDIRTYIPEEYIGWFALSMREDGRPSWLQSITPPDENFRWTGEFSIGLSNAGILTKLETYATYNVFNSISISAGPTAIVQFLNNRGTAQATTRFAIMFGAGYEF